jgi:hypothetical protein
MHATARDLKARASQFWGHVVGIRLLRAKGLEADSRINASAHFGAPLLWLSERGDRGVQVAAEDLL